MEGPPGDQDDWPNGQPNRPTPIEFSGPLTGPDFTVNYQQTALMAPMPFNEHNQQYGTYDRGVYYTQVGGAGLEESNVFLHVYPHNLCRARPSG